MTITFDEYKNHLIENLNKISKFAKYYSYTRDLSIRETFLRLDNNYDVIFYNGFTKDNVNDYISIIQNIGYFKYLLKSQVYLRLRNELIFNKAYNEIGYILFPDSCVPKILKFFDTIDREKPSSIKIDVFEVDSTSCDIDDDHLEVKDNCSYFTPKKSKLEININCEYINFVLEIPDANKYYSGYTSDNNTVIKSVTFLKDDIVPHLYKLLKMSNEINSIFNKNIKEKDISVTIPYSSDLSTTKYIAELMYKREAIPIKNIKSYLSDLVKGIELYPNYLKIDADINNNLFSFYLTNNPDELENDIAYIEEQLKNKTSLIWENCDISSSRIHKEMQLHVGWNVIGKIKRSDILQILKIAKQVLNDKITQCVNELNK